MMTIHIEIHGYPSIQADIDTPVMKVTKLRKNGVTIDVTPIEDNRLLIRVLKAKLVLNTITVKQL